MKFFNGNLVDTHHLVIAHGCNCSDGFGSGVAGAIKDRWPEVKQAYHAHIAKNGKGAHLLGTVQCVEISDHVVFNCFTQEHYGYDRAKYANMDAIIKSLGLVAGYCTETGIRDIAIPEIGCGRGGLLWSDLEPALVELEAQYGVEFTVYRYME